METAAATLEQRPALSVSGPEILAGMGIVDDTAICQILNISQRTLERRVADGLPVLMIGARRYFALDSLKTWLLAQERDRHQPTRRGRPTTRRAA